MESEVQTVQLLGAQANAEAVQGGISSELRASAGSSAEITFDGTIGDFQAKHPDKYVKFVLEPIAMQIVHQCQHSHEHFLEEMKKHRER